MSGAEKTAPEYLNFTLENPFRKNISLGLYGRTISPSDRPFPCVQVPLGSPGEISFVSAICWRLRDPKACRMLQEGRDRVDFSGFHIGRVAGGFPLKEKLSIRGVFLLRESRGGGGQP